MDIFFFSAPIDSPADKLTSIATISPFVPTAASETFSPNFSMIAVSAVLKSYWTILVVTMGNANSMIFLHNKPFSISISFFILLLIDISLYLVYHIIKDLKSECLSYVS